MGMKRLVIFLVIVFIPTIQLNAQSLEKIIWVTEDYPPFNYIVNGTPTGIGVDVLIEIWKRVGLDKQPKEIEIWPWPRGYKTLQERVDISLFTMAITEQRKKMFKFVGPYIKSRAGLLAKKSYGFKITSDDDLLNFYPGQADMQIGTLRDGNVEQLLLLRGYPKTKLYRMSQPDSLIRMLDLDRLSAVAFSYDVALWKMKTWQINPSQYELIYLLEESSAGFGFNKDIDPHILERLNIAFGALRKDGTLDRIIKKYKR